MNTVGHVEVQLNDGPLTIARRLLPAGTSNADVAKFATKLANSAGLKSYVGWSLVPGQWLHYPIAAASPPANALTSAGQPLLDEHGQPLTAA